MATPGGVEVVNVLGVRPVSSQLAGISSVQISRDGSRAVVIADRVPRRNLLIITQSTMLILAFILAVLTFTHLVQPWHIVVLALLLGTANAFDAPAAQAIADIPEPEQASHEEAASENSHGKAESGGHGEAK